MENSLNSVLFSSFDGPVSAYSLLGALTPLSCVESIVTAIIDRLHEHIENPHNATSAGIPQRVYPPITLIAVEETESKLGFLLPDLLREMYIHIGNGGFGPGYGIFGLNGGAPAYHGDGYEYSLVEYYQLHRGKGKASELEHDFATVDLFLGSPEKWFDKLLPICHWGCLHFLLLDCSKPDTPVIHFVGYGGALMLENPSFEKWIEAWLDGIDLGKLATGAPLTEEALAGALDRNMWTKRLQNLEPMKALDDELRQLVHQGKTISAIIKYQEKMCCGLQEAQENINSLMF